MSRQISFAPYEYYHLYNRGVDKRRIFLDEADYKRFLILLYLCNSEELSKPSELLKLHKHKKTDFIFDLDRGLALLSIGSYCLMPNHFHILIRLQDVERKNDEKSPVSEFMHKLTTAYSMYFNLKYGRKGGLFESRFKAKHVDSDEYLKYLFAYINLNPVKLIEPEFKQNGIKDAGATKKYIGEYPFSSYADLMKKSRPMSKILKLQDFPEYFEDPFDFEKMVDFYLHYNDM